MGNTQNTMHKSMHRTIDDAQGIHDRVAGVRGRGQPGIRVASRMACISSETSSGLFWVYVPSVKNGPDKCLVRGALSR